MSKKHQKYIEQQLIDLLNSRANQNKCGECGSQYPTWASYNIGLFLCGRCASLHRRLGSNISKVKSLTLDNWSNEQLESLRRIGNKKAKRKWNSMNVSFPFDEDDDTQAEQYIRDKYINKKFTNESLNDSEYGRDYSDEEESKPRSRSYSNVSKSKPSRSRSSTLNGIPKLSHRPLSNSEMTQYPTQLNKILDLGYQNVDSIAEALLLSTGNITKALDILDEDLKYNKQELPPPLPKRPSMSVTSSSSTNPQSSSTNGFAENNPLLSSLKQTPNANQNSDWWAGNSTQQQNSAQPTPQATQLQQPQIYQYIDPTTGIISYVDQTGQQYIDPNNAQHQQLLQQQQHQQQQNSIQQQQQQQQQIGINKNIIMSLYSQPDNFTSNVAAPVDPNRAQSTSSLYSQPTFGQQQQQLQQQQFTGYGAGAPQFQQYSQFQYQQNQPQSGFWGQQ